MALYSHYFKDLLFKRHRRESRRMSLGPRMTEHEQVLRMNSLEHHLNEEVFVFQTSILKYLEPILFDEGTVVLGQNEVCD
mmetsp:Transcript_1725/g.2247  ORF Transcript_1725/g.2247 Transcript_1725/m.2247 type:complete len:80 (+) Transcript_1725:118-357(+)